MSLVQRAVRGAAWITVTSMAGRVFSLVATLAVTHKIAPYEYGQASAATVVALSANMFAGVSLANFLIFDRSAGRPAAWHANGIHQLMGWLLIAMTLPLSPWLATMLKAPDLPRYLPGALLALAIDRLSAIPEKVVIRELRFRHLAITRMAGEVSYGVATLVAASMGAGGMALIYGVLTRAIVRSGLFLVAVPWREWSEPHAYDPALARRILDYSAPLWIGGISSFIGGNWDNLVVSRYFGPALMATYGLAFNLAEMPAAQIGEQLCEVLLPSFTRLDEAHRRTALVKVVLVVALVTFPVAVGLAAISRTMVRALFDPRWAAVAPMLTLLSVRSLTRTVYYPITQYIQAIGRTRYQMLLSVLHTMVLLAVIVTLGGRSTILTCIGVISCHVGLATLALVLVRREGVPLAPMAFGIIRVLLACGVMAAGVLGARALLDGLAMPDVLRLVAEVIVGGLVYVPAAFLLCGSIARDFLSWLRRGLGRSAEPTPG